MAALVIGWRIMLTGHFPGNAIGGHRLIYGVVNHVAMLSVLAVLGI